MCSNYTEGYEEDDVGVLDNTEDYLLGIVDLIEKIPEKAKQSATIT